MDWISNKCYGGAKFIDLQRRGERLKKPAGLVMECVGCKIGFKQFPAFGFIRKQFHAVLQLANGRRAISNYSRIYAIWFFAKKRRKYEIFHHLKSIKMYDWCLQRNVCFICASRPNALCAHFPLIIVNAIAVDFLFQLGVFKVVSWKS